MSSLLHIDYHSTLLLGSQSLSRQLLLQEAHIPFVVVPQTADEASCRYGDQLEEIVQSIARGKMAHIIMPEEAPIGTIAYVLTADTMSQDHDGTIHGKPIDRADAIAKLRSARNGSRLCTAFCLEKRQFQKQGWKTLQMIEQYDIARYCFSIPDHWIDRYLDHSAGFTASNAIAIEGYGGQFVRCIEGSYTTIIGLPMYQLRQSLEQLGFF